jgi:hypothetical protein
MGRGWGGGRLLGRWRRGSGGWFGGWRSRLGCEVGGNGRGVDVEVCCVHGSNEMGREQYADERSSMSFAFRERMDEREFEFEFEL